MLLLRVLDWLSHHSRSVTKSRDSSVGIATGYTQDRAGRSRNWGSGTVHPVPRICRRWFGDVLTSSFRKTELLKETLFIVTDTGYQMRFSSKPILSRGNEMLALYLPFVTAEKYFDPSSTFVLSNWDN
jgi:hypothetical protein